MDTVRKNDIGRACSMHVLNAYKCFARNAEWNTTLGGLDIGRT